MSLSSSRAKRERRVPKREQSEGRGEGTARGTLMGRAELSRSLLVPQHSVSRAKALRWLTPLSPLVPQRAPLIPLATPLCGSRLGLEVHGRSIGNR